MRNNPWNNRPPWALSDTIEVIGYLVNLALNLLMVLVGGVVSLVGLAQVGCLITLMAPFAILVWAALSALLGGR